MHYHAEVWLEEINNIDKQIEDVLYKYDENLEIEFCDVEEEYRKEHNTGSTERVKMPDDRLLLKWDDEFRIKGSIGTSFGTKSSTHSVPEHLKIINIPFKEFYNSFEEFIKDWAGYELTDKGYGYMHNPISFWDWFQIGGRWSGSHDSYKPWGGGKIKITTKNVGYVMVLDLEKTLIKMKFILHTHVMGAENMIIKQVNGLMGSLVLVWLLNFNQNGNAILEMLYQ